MSDYAYVADRAKKAFASVAQLESALERKPGDRALSMNLASMRRMAEQANADMLRLAEINKIEVCNYRLAPEGDERYGLEYVASSFLHYQLLFSQIYDALVNGPKKNASLGQEAKEASCLDFAYSYSGSLGIVLLAKSERDFFSGNLDNPIDALYQILDIEDVDNVKDIAKTLGNAVVKRIHDWTEATSRGGFAADIRWKRSDGVERGQMVGQRVLENIAQIIEGASDEETQQISVVGTLVGIDVDARTFHLTVNDGESYRGRLSETYPSGGQVIVPAVFRSDITKVERYFYATEKREFRYFLNRLTDPTLPSADEEKGPV